MSTRNKKLIQFIISIILLSGITSCGLKYTPPETPESFESKRHSTIEGYIRKGLQSDSSTYSSIAFGQTKTIKPASFKMLDSLFEVKYQNEQKMITDPELDNIIATQRQLVANDTSKVQYIEYHVFSYREGDSVRIVETEITLDRFLAIRDQEIISTLLIPRRMEENYKRYLFNESFLYPGTMATIEEERFYGFYQNAIDNSSGLTKDELILHTLALMELGYRKKSVRTNDLLIMQAKKELEKISKDFKIEAMSEIFSEVSQNDDEQEKTIYWFTVYGYGPDNKVGLDQYYFRFDGLLRVETMQKL
jgi:hypothetical protein